MQAVARGGKRVPLQRREAGVMGLILPGFRHPHGMSISFCGRRAQRHALVRWDSSTCRRGGEPWMPTEF